MTFRILIFHSSSFLIYVIEGMYFLWSEDLAIALHKFL